MEYKRCIFCREERGREELSVEHVFPQSIGGCLTIDSVCKRCNSFLGTEVDKHLTDHWLTTVRRHALGITGKRGKASVPFDRGILQHAERVKVSLSFPQNRPVEAGVLSGKTVRSRGDVDLVQFRVDARRLEELPEIVNKFLRRQNVPEKTREEIMDNARAVKIDNPWIAVGVEIDTKMFKKAILKIAYELAWRWLGDDFLDDPVANMIRRSVIEDSFDYPLRGEICMIGEQGPMIPFWDSAPLLHIGALSNIAGNLFCYVRIFSDFNGGIVVSESPATYSNFHSGFLALDPVKRTVARESTLEEEIAFLFG